MSEFLIDRFERDFQVWNYTVGMRRLLLRSNKEGRFDTRIDILFQNVQAMRLPTHLHGVRVSEADDVEKASLVEQFGQGMVQSGRLFHIENRVSIGFVVAGLVTEAVDDREYFEPSQFKPDL
ncbi:MAG: hypothetical protein JWN70_3302 [Planctomycetaceae bacterium]|nr:hypothetical protein [Planctomycetaceae bacterium]